MENACPMAKKRKIDSGSSSNSNDSEDVVMNNDNAAAYANAALQFKLRQFDILDEVQCDDSGSENSTGNCLKYTFYINKILIL